MFNSIKKLSALTVGILCSLGIASSANAASLINNGTIQLGVDDLGQLNIPGGSPSSGTGTTVVGLRYLPTGAEATAPGCLCEGWGVADAGTGVTGYANNAIGTAGLTAESFTSDGISAIVKVLVGGTFEVTHEYRPSDKTKNLYEDFVTIANIGSSEVSDLRYRRVMDWDIEPTAFNEVVTIGGTAASSKVLFASDNGFASANPLVAAGSILATGDFVNSGPADHGAVFDFGFGALGVGKSVSFKTYYGAAGTERDAIGALAAVGAEVYSLGKPADGVASGGAPNTFIFAFSGVGGKPVSVPEPSSILGLLMLGGLGASVGLLRKQKASASKIG